VLFEKDPVRTGLRYCITFFAYATFAVLGGAFCSRTKMIKFPTIFGFTFMIIFFICMATVGLGSSDAVWGYPLFLGIALGIVLCALVSVAQFSTPPSLISTTSGLLISVRSLGGTVGIAICKFHSDQWPNFQLTYFVVNAVFTAKLSGSIGPKIAGAVLPLGFNPQYLPELIGGLASNNVTAIGLVPGVTPAIIGAGVGGLLEAYATGFRFVWISAGCFVVVAWICKFTKHTIRTMCIKNPMLIY